MANMDMEIDTGTHFNLEVPQDDDLINYESDTGAPLESRLDDVMEEPAADTNDTSKPDESIAAEEFDEQYQNNNAEDAAANDDGHASEELDAPAPQDSHENDVTADADQEIDYDLGETHEDAEDDPEAEGGANGGTQEQAASETVPVEVASAENEAQEGDDNEISWEPEVDFSSGANEDDEEEEEAADESEQNENEETHDQELENIEVPVKQGTDNNQPEVETAGSQHSVHDGDEGDEEQYPNITVQYKGDTFPFFSHSSEGFFSDLKVLDGTMETVLAGFRSELQNEISSEDDIVFQVDELGLEFTEATNHDSLAHLTMRQIVEVFDLLVKNQDPASSRTLYTYLFTKPNPSRRFDSLVESATSGKRLDDLSYLFESHVHNGSPEGKTSHDDAFGAELDNYESAEDDTTGALPETDLLGGVGELYDEQAQSGENGIGIDGLAEEDAGHFLDSFPRQDDALDVTGEDDIANNGQVSAFDEQLEIGNDAAEETGLSSTANDEATNENADGIDDDINFGGDEPIESIIDEDSILPAPEEHNVEQEEEEEVDELNEIDWREDEEIAEEGDVASTTGKRSRGDDDAGVEDEQDPKRVRS